MRVRLPHGMAPNVTPHDAEIEMAELEMEENRILRELKEMDEKVNDSTLQKKRHSSRDEPKQALNALLAECEGEVREAKGYISATGPPLRIARCKRGEGVPNHATYLSRPKGTGVDFTVPVTLKEYFAVVKHPIFLNGIRDKCAANKYNSPEEYIADMKLLSKNTAIFNKGPELAWVVQHAKLLLECAEEAVRRRNRQFNEIMIQLGSSSGGGSRRIGGKRKRSSSDANGSTSHPSIGTTIQVFWEHDRKWYQGIIRDKSGSEVQIYYENDNNPEWIDLNGEAKWRLPAMRSKRLENASKRKKGSSTPSVPHSRGAPTVSLPTNIVTRDDLGNLREDLMAAVDDSKQVMLNTLQASTVSIENKLSRSDALHRVLLAVSDMQTSLQGRMDSMQEIFEDLKHSVYKLEKRITDLQDGSQPRSRSRSRNDNRSGKEGSGAAQDELEKNLDEMNQVDKASVMESDKSPLSGKEKEVTDVPPAEKEKESSETLLPVQDSDEAPTVMDVTDWNLKQDKQSEMKEADSSEIDGPVLPKDQDTLKNDAPPKEISESKEIGVSTSLCKETGETKAEHGDGAESCTEQKSDVHAKESESKEDVDDSDEVVVEVQVEDDEEKKSHEAEASAETAGLENENSKMLDTDKEKELRTESGEETNEAIQESVAPDDVLRKGEDGERVDLSEGAKLNGVKDSTKQDKGAGNEVVSGSVYKKSALGRLSPVTKKRPKAVKSEDADDSSSSSESSSDSSSSSSDDDDDDDDERGEKTRRTGLVEMDVDSSSPPRKPLDKAQGEQGDDS